MKNKWIKNPAVALLACALVLCAALAPRLGLAQPYPVNNPTYIPTAILGQQTITPAVGSSYVFQVNGLGTIYMRVSGVPVGLSSQVQGTEGRAPQTLAGTFTVTSATPAVFTQTAHGYSINQPVVPTTTGALYTGLTAGTTYYVIAAGLTANAFEVSATPGGAAVNTSGSQSGTHTMTSTSLVWNNMSVDQVGGWRTTAVTGTGLYRIDVSGLAAVRLNVAALTSGATYVEFSGGPGAEFVRTNPMVRSTYRAYTSISTGATNNFLVVAGSATKTVFVTRAECSGRATAALTVSVTANKRSTADTGDAGTAVTIAPLDSNMAAATATVVSHTTSPTPGTSVGAVAAGQMGIVALGGTPLIPPIVLKWDFGITPGSPHIMLRGVAEEFSLTTDQAFGSGAVVTCGVEFQED